MTDATTDPRCTLCGGEGFTDNNADENERAPWSFWASLTPPSDLAVRLGLVQRTACVRCEPCTTERPTHD